VALGRCYSLSHAQFSLSVSRAPLLLSLLLPLFASIYSPSHDSQPHNDDWEANFEDLMAMEDSYGSGVEDLSSAAAELTNRRMAETKRLREERRRLRGIQPGDRVRVQVRQGAPYPEPIGRYHYTSPFGGTGLGHRPSSSSSASPPSPPSSSPGATARGSGSGGRGGTGAANVSADKTKGGEEEEDFEFSAAAAASQGESSASSSAPGLGFTGGGGGGRGGGGGGGGGRGAGEQAKRRRWKIVQTTGYVVAVRGNRVGVKRGGHPEDTEASYPTFPKEWVEVLDVG
jgi:hypothetical protein